MFSAWGDMTASEKTPIILLVIFVILFGIFGCFWEKEKKRRMREREEQRTLEIVHRVMRENGLSKGQQSSSVQSNNYNLPNVHTSAQNSQPANRRCHDAAMEELIMREMYPTRDYRCTENQRNQYSGSKWDDAPPTYKKLFRDA